MILVCLLGQMRHPSRILEHVVSWCQKVRLIAVCVPEQLVLLCVSLPLPLVASGGLEHSFAGALPGLHESSACHAGVFPGGCVDSPRFVCKDLPLKKKKKKKEREREEKRVGGRERGDVFKE